MLIDIGEVIRKAREIGPIDVVVESLRGAHRAS
jgi:hypothetical protein